jgi:hypothetical protein
VAGLDLYEGDSADAFAEIDLLFASGGQLHACEAKTNAHAFTHELALEMIQLAKRIGAQPVLAAPAGGWRDDVAALADQHDLLLLGPEFLLETPARPPE